MVQQQPPLWGPCPFCSSWVRTADSSARHAVVGCVLGERVMGPPEVLTSRPVALEGVRLPGWLV